jgi:hypothetical protein
MAADGVSQGFQEGGGLADPVSQRGTVKINAFAVEDLTLAIERQVISILADQNMGQQARARAAALDGPRGQRGLHEPLAARTGQTRANDAVHDKPAGNVFQFLGDILTDPAQAPATVGTGIGTGAEFHFHPGDVIRDQTALGFVLLLNVRQLHPRGHGRRRNLAGLKCQLKLLGRLGRGPEPVRPVPGKLMAQLLDQDRLRLHFRQKPRGEAAQLLGVFRQGQGLIQHAKSLSHCIRCGNH